MVTGHVALALAKQDLKIREARTCSGCPHHTVTSQVVSVTLVQQGLFLRILAIKASAIPSASYTDNGSAFLHIVSMSGPHKAHVYQVIPLYTSKNSYAHFKLPS